MKYRVSLLAAAGLTALSAASAQEVDNGWYGVLGAGYAFENDNIDIQSEDPTRPAVFSSDIEVDGGPALFGAIGRHLGNGLRAELELSHRNQDVSDIPGDGLGFGGFPSNGTLGDLGATALMVNLFKDFAVSERVQPYIGAGIGMARLRFELDNVDGQAAAQTLGDAANGYRVFAQNSDTVPAYQARAGLKFNVAENVMLDLGYRFLGTWEYGTEFFVNNEPANVNGTYQVQELTVGLHFPFGATAAPAPVVRAAPEPVVQTKTCLDGTVVPMGQPCPIIDEDALTPEELRTVVYFEFDRAELSSSAQALLQRRANEASEIDLVEVLVSGNTDTSGSASYNQRLSQRRAAVVREALVGYGVDGSKIRVRALGETNLAKSTGDGVREPLNRRTEVDFDF